ncbi:MAG TPA: hypothetical protein VH092_05130 [Urbifossiella sp.]|nr:hypothetical protein [Urbifossiella sp.]
MARVEGDPETVTFTVLDRYGGRTSRIISHPIGALTLPGRYDPEETARAVVPGVRFVLSPATMTPGLWILDPTPSVPAALEQIAAIRATPDRIAACTEQLTARHKLDHPG